MPPRGQGQVERLFMSCSNRPYGFTCVHNSGNEREIRRAAQVFADFRLGALDAVDFELSL
ncbi:hypothetical protein ABZ434_20410 [Streptomyces sp. NPDC005761]|uniref:hypothetical protein n=1 Tax=unclassified Streptomyces TaxID=2593676 RepID=UPI0033D30204